MAFDLYESAQLDLEKILTLTLWYICGKLCLKIHIIYCVSILQTAQPQNQQKNQL